jgi:outer membrane protein TolC
MSRRLATFGRIKTATANANIPGLEVDRQLEQVQAAVVTAQQASLTAKKTIPIARQEVASAEEALRLTQKESANRHGSDSRCAGR